ncbi:hypothetical protein DB347_20655 [Opitutaceae bacterium EW11]|nr:hypothetical protein DB347_20655 [Opitutaceae bacterium EW11]
MSVDFSPLQISLLDGMQYAVAVEADSFILWYGTDGGYSGGSMYTANSGGSFALFPTQSGDRDLGFRVSVEADSVP